MSNTHHGEASRRHTRGSFFVWLPSSLMLLLVIVLLLSFLSSAQGSNSLLDQLLHSLSRQLHHPQGDTPAQPAATTTTTTLPNQHPKDALLAQHGRRLGLYQHALQRHYQSLLPNHAGVGSKNQNSNNNNATQQQQQQQQERLEQWADQAYQTYLWGYDLEVPQRRRVRMDDSSTRSSTRSSSKPQNDTTSRQQQTTVSAVPPLAYYRSVLTQRHNGDGGRAAFPPFPTSKRLANQALIQQMLQRSYDAYLYHAWPALAGEVAPVSCRPQDFSLVQIPGLTLLDALDTLLVVGHNVTEFARAVERLRQLHARLDGGLFGVDQNVSLFETNIRVLGGLLSAHQLAQAWLPDAVLFRHDVFLTNGHVRTGRDDAQAPPVCPADWNDEDDDTDVASAAAAAVDCSAHEDDNLPPPPLSTASSSGMVGSDTVGWTASHHALMNNNIKRRTRRNKRLNATAAARIRQQQQQAPLWVYDGVLLELALDLGQRLLAAFDTNTGIPYGTVHLQSGQVPRSETPIASAAGGGTLALEFSLLSRLTGHAQFERAATRATQALWVRQSTLYLVGKHIDVQSGAWTETLSGIGSNSDSFTEYLAKQYFLFHGDSSTGLLRQTREPTADDFWLWFVALYSGIFLELRRGDWYADADWQAGRKVSGRRVMEALMAFYPGLQVLSALEVTGAARSLNAMFHVREYLGFLPERFLYDAWKVEQGGGLSGAGKHLLRPELLESAYLLHRAALGTTLGSSSSSSSWLWASDFALTKLETLTAAPCGHAALADVRPTVTGLISDDHPTTTNRQTIKRLDEMPSFFLTETLKYLYLTFDNDSNDSDNSSLLHHDGHNRNWIFTTEAHPIHMPIPHDPNDNDTTAATTTDEGLATELQVLEQLLVQRIQGDGVVNFEAAAAAVQDGRHHQPAKKSSSSSWWPLTGSITKEYHKLKHHVEEQMDESTDDMWDEGSYLSKTNFFGYGHLIQPRHHHNHKDDNTPGGWWWNEAEATWAALGLQEGWNLRKACPNYHATPSHLLWMHALHGSRLVDAYVPRFVAVASNVDAETLRDRAPPRIPVAHALGVASASWQGRYSETVALSRNDLLVGTSCRVVLPEKPASFSTDHAQGGSAANAAAAEDDASITDVQTEMGRFQIKSFEGGASGFGVEQVDTGHLLTATFVQDIDLRFVEQQQQQGYMNDAEAATTAEFVMVHAIYPESPSNNNNHHARSERVVLMSDLKGNSFGCTVELVQRSSNNHNSPEGEVLFHVPCTPALFGPTHMTNLVQYHLHNDLFLEGSLFAPPAQDAWGCNAIDPAARRSNQHNNHMQTLAHETCPNHVVQMVHRGDCSFIDKAWNMKYNHNAVGLIVVNSEPLQDSGGGSGGGEDVFIMSYGMEDVVDQKYLSRAMPVTVLVSSSDGKDLWEAMTLVQQQQSSVENDDLQHVFARIALRQQAVPAVEDAVHPSFPVVRASPSLLRVFSRGGWGIQAVQQQEADGGGGGHWHLQLMRHELREDDDDEEEEEEEEEEEDVEAWDIT